jgi:hypothetical protein
MDKLQLPKVTISMELDEPVGLTPESRTPGRNSLRSGSKSPLTSGRNSRTKPASLPSTRSMVRDKSAGVLVEGTHVPRGGGSYFNFSHENIKQTAVKVAREKDEEEYAGADDDEEDALYGAAQGLGAHAPKKSAGQMSRISKNSAASSDHGDRLDDIFVQPFVRANAKYQESHFGRYVSRILNKVSTKVFFWSFLSVINIGTILFIFYWSSGKLSRYELTCSERYAQHPQL